MTRIHQADPDVMLLSTAPYVYMQLRGKAWHQFCHELRLRYGVRGAGQVYRSAGLIRGARMKRRLKVWRGDDAA